MAKPLYYEVPRSYLGYLEGSFPWDELPPNGALGWFIYIDENALAYLVIADLESFGGPLTTALMQGEISYPPESVQPNSDEKECA